MSTNDEKAFLSKHLKNWENNRNIHSAMTLLADNADVKLGITFTPELRKAAGSAVSETMLKAKEALQGRQEVRAVILAMRGFRVCQKLGNGLERAFSTIIDEAVRQTCA